MAAPDPINTAFDEYVAAYNRGEGDPTPFLERFQGAERRELEILVDTFLEDAPRVAFDPDGSRDQQAEAVAAAVMSRIGGASGGLSRLVRKLREQRQLKSADVIGELAVAFDANEHEREKIDAYYHSLEWGSLPASGLSDRLLDSLATVLETSRERLREAGQALGPARASATGPVFARMVEDADLEQAPEVPTMKSPGSPAEPPDRIDQLFTGGPQGA